MRDRVDEGESGGTRKGCYGSWERNMEGGCNGGKEKNM